VDRERVLSFRQRAMMKRLPLSRSLARPRPPSIQRTTSWVAHFLAPSALVRFCRVGRSDEVTLRGGLWWAPLAVLIATNGPLRANPLTQPENAYVALMTMSIGIANMCDGYDVDDMTVLKFAQERGVEIHRLGPATFNALEAVVGSSYDPTALIPEVTLLVGTVSDKMNHDVSKSGKAAVCKLYGKHLTSAGFLRVK